MPAESSNLPATRQGSRCGRFARCLPRPGLLPFPLPIADFMTKPVLKTRWLQSTKRSSAAFPSRSMFRRALMAGRWSFTIGIFIDSPASGPCEVDPVDGNPRLRLAGGSERVPFLEDVLDLVNGRQPLIVEIKNRKRPGALEPEVSRILRNYKGAWLSIRSIRFRLAGSDATIQDFAEDRFPVRLTPTTWLAGRS